MTISQFPNVVTPTPPDLGGAGYDAVDKLRVSTPQALIDTDFEYGIQPTKWETVSLQNNRPSCFYDPAAPLTFTGISGAGTRVVTVLTTTPPAVGSVIYIQNATDFNACGWFYVDTISAGVNFTYTAAAVIASGTIFDPDRTYMWVGSFYSGAGILLGSVTAFTYVGTTITCTTTGAHGLEPNNNIYVRTTTATTNAPNGAWVVATTPTQNTFTFQVVNTPTGTIGNTANALTLNARPDGVVEQRAFDGGVAFTAGAICPNSQTMRQTRRYFRYQSGKGIQFSTGSTLQPALFTTQITASGTTVTVTCRFPHNLAIGTTIIVSGCLPVTYNGTYVVASTPTQTTLTYVVPVAPATTPATGFPQRVSAKNWYGSAVRVGIFDLQNGMFFEYDGQTLYTVRRNSVLQLNGVSAITQGSQIVNGTGTQFSSQLDTGDYIVIRGQSYRILGINSDTQLLISPEYKGVTLTSGVIISKTIDAKTPQSQWDDPCNGTGPSGYNLDLTRMQMWFIDYSWYGAGVIRFGLRTTQGTVAYVYTFVNNNLQYEAYMRSGNLPAHYESTAVGPLTKLSATLDSSATTGALIQVADASQFAPTGSVRITQPGGTGVVEYITYTAKTATTLTIGARAQAGGQATAQTFTYSATAPVTVTFAAPDTAATLAHWGSSVIMDGRFDDDKSLLFNFGQIANVSVAPAAVQPLLSIRLAPSVDNGFTGVMGAREIINRMQLKPSELGIYSSGPFLIQMRLNGRPSGGTFVSAGGSSLSQVATHAVGQTYAGGESVAAAYTNTNGQTTLDLTQVRDLGNSILGGGTNNVVPNTTDNLYPDGPDVLTVVATNIGAAAATIQARLTWTEAQA
jgi:hypothetical protein